MTKTEFIEKVRELSEPVLQFECSDIGDNASHGPHLYSGNGIGGPGLIKWIGPFVRLSDREYYSGDHSSFNARMEAIEKKYRRWFEEAIKK